MDRLIQLSQLGASLVQFALFGDGRTGNPFYDEEATKVALKPHRIGEGKVMSVPLSKLVSTQATIHYSKVRSIAGKIKRGTIGDAGMPTATKVGDRFFLRDGNHRASGNRLAGKRMVKIKVQ